MAAALQLCVCSALPIRGCTLPPVLEYLGQDTVPHTWQGLWDQALHPVTLIVGCREAQRPWGLCDHWYEPNSLQGAWEKLCAPGCTHLFRIAGLPWRPTELQRPQEVGTVGIVVSPAVSLALSVPVPPRLPSPPFSERCWQLQKELLCGDVSEGWLKRLER